MFTRRLLAVATGVTVAAGMALPAAFVSGAAAHVGGVAVSSVPVVFSDPAGDASGPDVTSVAIGNDPVSGTVQITVTANRFSTIDPALYPEVDVWLNTDKDISTGAGGGVGSDYLATTWRNWAGNLRWALERWNGTAWEQPQSATVSYNLTGDVITWTLNKADLGDTSGFDFYVTTCTYDANGYPGGFDFAPDEGQGPQWSYILATTLKPVIGTPTTTPKNATAGTRFTVRFPVTNSDDGQPLTEGRMICDPSVKGKVIAHAEQFIGGVARLSFTIPKNAKGKLLKVKLTIVASGGSATKVTTFAIR